MNRGLRLTLILSFLAYNVVELVLIQKFPIIFELIIFLLHVWQDAEHRWAGSFL